MTIDRDLEVKNVFNSNEIKDENEYSSGWRKINKDKKSEKLNAEAEKKYEDLKTRIDDLVSSITNISQKESVYEETSKENLNIKQLLSERALIDSNNMKQLLDEKISILSFKIEEMKKELDLIKSELSEYKNVLYNQLAILVEIMEIEKSKEGTGIEAQKSFINNIFKKK
jgi:RecJ-like exonuclease